VVIACSSALLTALMPPTTGPAPSDEGSGVTSVTPGHTAVAVDPAPDCTNRPEYAVWVVLPVSMLIRLSSVNRRCTHTPSTSVPRRPQREPCDMAARQARRVRLPDIRYSTPISTMPYRVTLDCAKGVGNGERKRKRPTSSYAWCLSWLFLVFDAGLPRERWRE